MDCFICGSSSKKDAIFCGGDCETFLCRECFEDPDRTDVFTWLSPGEEILDMISEDEVLVNEELVCDELNRGEFYCPNCLHLS